MKAAILQPYLFPYLGYFQLINIVDKFTFYDDVNFIKKGWIHRNNILVNGEPHLFTIPCIKASQNKLINEINVSTDLKLIHKLLNTIHNQYKNAPFFDKVYSLIESVLFLTKKEMRISELSIQSIREVIKYLDINIEIYVSSIDHSGSRSLDKSDRIITICKEQEASTYINPIGGQELYSKEDFKQRDIELKFIKQLPIHYKQFEKDFVSNLSIIDIMMFNSSMKIKNFLNQYELI